MFLQYSNWVFSFSNIRQPFRLICLPIAAPHPGKGGVDSIRTLSRYRRRGGRKDRTNWNCAKATSQYPKDIRCPPSPIYHELVLQGFQNLVGLTPEPNQNNKINHNVLSQYLQGSKKPCRIRSKPYHEFQTNNHVLAPYLQGFQNLAGSGTGDKKARRPINPKNKNSGLPATNYILLILFQ